MNYSEISGDLFQVEYYDESGTILFEETLTRPEVDIRSKLVGLSEKKFLKALVAQPKGTHRVFE